MHSPHGSSCIMLFPQPCNTRKPLSNWLVLNKYYVAGSAWLQTNTIANSIRSLAHPSALFTLSARSSSSGRKTSGSCTAPFWALPCARGTLGFCCTCLSRAACTTTCGASAGRTTRHVAQPPQSLGPTGRVCSTSSCKRQRRIERRGSTTGREVASSPLPVRTSPWGTPLSRR